MNRNISENSIIIVPNNMIFQTKEQFKNTVGIDVVTVKQLLQKFMLEEIDEVETIFKYYELLSDLPLKKYQLAINEFPFLEAIYNCIEKIKRYDLNIDLIIDEEMKLILKTLVNIKTITDLENEVLNTLKLNKKVYVVDAIYTFDEQFLINKIPHALISQTLNAKKTVVGILNKRQEIEYIAQKIIKENLPLEQIKISVPNLEYEKFVKQVFQRYHIPYALQEKIAAHPFSELYKAVFEYLLTDNYERLLYEDFFGLQQKGYDLKKIIQYYEIFTFDNTIQLEDFDENLIIDEKTNTNLKTLFININPIVAEFKYLLQNLDKNQLETTFLYVDKIISEKIKTEDDLIFIKKAQVIFQKGLNYFDLKYLFIFKKQIETITVPNNMESGVLIQKLYASTYYRKYHFVVGCDAKNYPAFKAETGVFSENFYNEIQYASLQERYEFHLKQLAKLVNFCDELYYTYSITTLEGKPLELAFELVADETVVKINHTQKIIQATHFTGEYRRKKREFYIENPKKLYLVNNCFKTSVSAIELYNNCPLSFFLEKGLKLYRDNLSFDARIEGNLVHKVLELLILKYQNNYKFVEKNIVFELVSKLLNTYFTIFKNATGKKALTLYLTNRIKETLLFLQEAEADYEEILLEKRYEFQLSHEDIEIILRGIIDRVSIINNQFYIYDYKLGEKKFSKTDYLAGIQIQLPTYLVAMQKESNLTAIGAYYLKIGDYLQNINYKSLHANTKEAKIILETNIEYFKQEYLKAASFKGILIKNWINKEEQEQFLQTLDNNLELFKTNYSEDFSEIRKRLEIIYKESVNEILSGEIKQSLKESFLRFPEFKGVIQKRGYRKKQMILSEEERQKLEEEHEI